MKTITEIQLAFLDLIKKDKLPKEFELMLTIQLSALIYLYERIKEDLIKNEYK